MKIAIIREGKTPPDERVPLTPKQSALALQTHSGLKLCVESSEIRCFSDERYTNEGVEVIDRDALKDSDVLFGVKEVPIDELIEEKTYVFFSHTAKLQPYNKDLLKAIVAKKITLIDWEYLTDKKGARLIGFGRYAGIVGAYNGFRAYGLRHNSFKLKPAHQCEDLSEVLDELCKVKLSPIKVLLTGRGRVARGAMEILDHIGIRKVDKDAYLNKEFDEPVYALITFKDYFKRSDSGRFLVEEFFANPQHYESDFMQFAEVTDYYIAGHFWNSESPFLFTREDARSEGFRISLVADISCDIDGPVASTIRPTSIENPFYGYDPKTEQEVEFDTDGAITVMAVDNLPCELPKDASHDFGQAILQSILPSFLNGDKDEILSRATIVKNGAITPQFSYLEDWINEN